MGVPQLGRHPIQNDVRLVDASHEPRVLNEPPSPHHGVSWVSVTEVRSLRLGQNRGNHSIERRERPPHPNGFELPRLAEWRASGAHIRGGREQDLRPGRASPNRTHACRSESSVALTFDFHPLRKQDALISPTSPNRLGGHLRRASG